MSNFRSWDDYRKFATVVRSQQRFIRTPELEAFLNAVLKTAEKRVDTMKAGWPFWRAQRGNDLGEVKQDGETFTEYRAYLPERMKPLLDKAMEGRVNAKGIPCLYGATTRETAMAEVRPWLGARVSVGQFKTLRELEIVDCSKFHAKSEFSLLLDRPVGHVLSPDEIEEAVWTHIDHAFAEPVSETDDEPDYVPTQILAELFKTSGYDGLAYKESRPSGSTLTPGSLA